ncbi:MAG TPA: hypothetical protein VGE40_11775 [Bacilli bacterium]
MWIGITLFALVYCSMIVCVRLFFNFLHARADCTDEVTMRQCDGKAKRLLTIFMTLAISLVIINWLVIWY